MEPNERDKLNEKRIPHACGGEPGGSAAVSTIKAYSPRMWG